MKEAHHSYKEIKKNYLYYKIKTVLVDILILGLVILLVQTANKIF
jgi:hypothetical protein